MNRWFYIWLLLAVFFAAGLNAQPLLELKDVTKASESINTEVEESYPLFSPDGRLYFVRSLYKGNVGGERAGQDIWFSDKLGDDFDVPSNQMGKLNNIFNNGVVGIADGGKVLYLNSTYSNKFDYQVGLARSEFKDGEWSVPSRVRIKRFNPKTGFLSYYVDEKNEVLLLSFSKSSGYSEDLYVSFKSPTGWEKPLPLGPTINSNGDEFSPFLSEDGRYLYFSSTGWPGKGGTDIFMSRRLDDTWQNWSEPMNLPEPINSASFDAYFTITGTTAYFSSNRDGDFSDIFIATYDRIIQEQIKDSLKSEDEYLEKNLLAGKLNADDLSDIQEVSVIDESGDEIQKVEIAEDGSFTIEDLDDYAKYELRIDAKKAKNLSALIQNPDGQEIYLGKSLATGNYPFETMDQGIKPMLDAVVSNRDYASNRAYFGMSADNFDFNKMEIALLDDQGERIEKSIVNEKGEFDFKKLNSDGVYALDIENNEYFMDLFLFNENGKQALADAILKGVLFKKLPNGVIEMYRDELLDEPTAAKFAFDYDRLDAVGTRVVLLDQRGNALQSAVVNSEGLFAFSSLDPDQQYSLKFDDALDQNGPIALFGFTEEGDRIALASDIAKGKKFVGNPAFSKPPTEDEEVFSFTDESGNAPPAGTKVYVKDENDVVLDSGYVDAQGNITFTRLPADVGFKLQLANTDDLSMGLSRFFITDAEGTKVEIDESGSTVGTIVTAELAAGTEKFTFAEDAAPPPGTMVYVTDENDVVIDSAEVDEYGEIRFTRLPADGNYKLKLDKAIDASMGLDRFFIVDAEGEKIGFDASGSTVKSIVGKELAENTETFTFEADGAPPVGTMVYVTDENDNIIDSAEVDEYGEIRFTRLPADGNYKLKLDKAVDMSAGLGRFFIIDAEGEKIGFNEDGETVKSIVGQELAETSEKFTFEGDTGPPPGTVVYVTDENDNIIDSATVDEFGEIRFTRLPADGNFKLKLDKAIDNSMGLDRFFITDAAGEKVGFNADGTTEMKLVSKSEALRTDYYKFNFKRLPPEGSMVYLLDASNMVIDSARVDANGGFRFKRLNGQKDYSLKVVSPDGSEFKADFFELIDKSGKLFKLKPALQLEDFFAGMTEEDVRLNYDMFQFGFDKLPKSGTKIYLYDALGTKIDSTVIFGIGEFNFGKLDPMGTYYIKLKDKSFDQSMASLFALLENGKRNLKYLYRGFEYRPIDNLDNAEDTQLDISGFLNAPIVDNSEVLVEENSTVEKVIPETPIAAKLVGPLAFLIDPITDKKLDSSLVDQDGSFAFSGAASDRSGVIRFNDSISSAGVELYLVSNGAQSEIDKFNGDYNYDASVMKGATFLIVKDEKIETAIQEPVAEVIPEYPSLPKAYLDLSSAERYARYDQFQFDDENLPKPGTKILISNEKGELVQKATLFEHGLFIADKLKEKGSYSITTDDEKFNSSNGKAFAMSTDGRKILDKTDDRFTFEVLESQSDGKVTNEDMNFILATSSTLKESQDVYLFEAESKKCIDTLTMAQDGSFSIANLNRSKKYRVELGDSIDLASSQMYSTLGSDKKELEKKDGGFVIDPIKLLEGKGSELLVSFKNADADKPKVDLGTEQYPLTPPVDDNNKSIAVKKDVVNNTVFEKPPVVKEEPKSRKAMAVIDYSDFRLPDGTFAEVVETRKGWNLHFDFNEFLLSKNQMDYVYEVLIPLLKKNPDMTLVLEGHTDSIGTEDVNYRMSVLRISNVLYHIEMNGIEDTRIKVRPKGEAEPLAPNSTEEGRAINRRVEIIKNSELEE